MEWKFKTKEQMINAHTEITYLFNIETNREFDERAMERFNVVKKNWKGLEYKTDNFCVIPPKKPSEIVMEGIVLNHCVSSYVELVLNGETNIFFVRRSSDIEKPFYTLEIRHNKVRQCHGFDDCNIDEVEGLEEFLKDYCKEKNIKYDCPDAVL
jgi:hypothetical protein